MTRETLVYDRIADEVVSKDELARREARRPKKRMALPAFLDKPTERGSWVWDPKLQKVVTKAEYYGRNPVVSKGDGLQVIPDIQPYQATRDRSVIGGRRQHREYLRRHGLIEYGNEKPKNEVPPPPPAAPDIKDAIDYLRAGHPAPRIEGINDRKLD